MVCVLAVPAPKEMKSALIQLQECAAADFLQKHGLKGASGNKLAKIKRGQFEEVRASPQQSCQK
jgi:hypothetical protein